MGASCTSGVIVDESSAISEQDKKNVKSTWSKLYKDWESEHGVAFFIRLFKNHPNVKTTFKSLTSLSDEELVQSPVLRAHVIVFGNTVNTWIQKLDDSETLVALVQKLTDSHVIRGVKDPQLFKAALGELLAYAQEKFSFNQLQIDAWTKIANLIASVIEQRVNDLKG